MDKFKRYLGTTFLCSLFLVFAPDERGFWHRREAALSEPLTIFDNTLLARQVMNYDSGWRLWRYATAYPKLCTERQKNDDSYQTRSCAAFGREMLDLLTLNGNDNYAVRALSVIDDSLLSKYSDVANLAKSLSLYEQDVCRENLALLKVFKPAVDAFLREVRFTLFMKVSLLHVGFLFAILFGFKYRQKIGGVICAPFSIFKPIGKLLGWVHSKV